MRTPPQELLRRLLWCGVACGRNPSADETRWTAGLHVRARLRCCSCTLHASTYCTSLGQRNLTELCNRPACAACVDHGVSWAPPGSWHYPDSPSQLSRASRGNGVECMRGSMIVTENPQSSSMNLIMAETRRIILRTWRSPADLLHARLGHEEGENTINRVPLRV